MTRARHLAVVGLLVACCVSVPHAQAPAPTPTQTPAPVALTPQEMEVFLKTARVVRKRRSSKGVTNAIRATLSDGRIEHEAQIQTVDEAQPLFQAGNKSEVNFKDTYRFNIGGYRLARLLGLNVPMSVARRVEGKDAAVTWWIDDVQFDEEGRKALKAPLGPSPDRTLKQLTVMAVWDELIQNRDRNQGNIVWTSGWTLWLIDHTRAFRLGGDLVKPDQLVRCDRALLAAMRTLTLAGLTAEMGDIMKRDELEAVIARRDRLVKHFDDRIARIGEASVLFSM